MESFVITNPQSTHSGFSDMDKSLAIKNPAGNCG